MKMENDVHEGLDATDVAYVEDFVHREIQSEEVLSLKPSYKVGDTVMVVDPCMKGQSGGTEFLIGTYQVRIKKAWYDYEIGQRYIGTLVKEEDIEKAKETGTSRYSLEHFRQYGETVYTDTKQAFETFDPRTVYFGRCDIER